uniref:Ribosomal protein L15 n=1 Tax=Ailuropoda melanoleuca TaxID=9646 RepID=G1L241_AILME
WWEYKLVQSLWKTIWKFLKKLKISLFFCQQQLAPAPRGHNMHRRRYKASQGYVTYLILECLRGPRHPVPKEVTYGKPVHHGSNQLQFAQSLQSVVKERPGHHYGALRVLSSYRAREDSMYKFFEVILIDSLHKTIKRDPDPKWITKPVHKHRVM